MSTYLPSVSSSISNTDITSVVSGHRFEMKKRRTWSQAFQQSPSSFSISPGECKKWAVFTTIFQPSPSIKALDKLYPEWCTVVVGDKISPSKEEFMKDLKHVEYITLAEQQDLAFLSVQYTPERSFARLNLGYLYAIARGAEVIFDVDDDNYLADAKLDVPETFKAHISNFRNPYKFFIDDPVGVNMWPRGMPLDTINATAMEKLDFKTISKSQVGVIQCLANREPDVDSIHRLTSRHVYPFYFQKKDYSVAISKDIVVPTNAQATIFFKEVFWALFLPASVHGRVTDIWRAYISQSIYHKSDLLTIFRNCGVRHDRSAHDFMKDFASEVSLFERAPALVEFLEKMDPPVGKISASVVFDRWKIMYEYGIIEESDLLYIQAWLNDLANIKKDFA